MEEINSDVYVIADHVFNENSKKEKYKLLYGIVTEMILNEE